jgi:hypothetical protein
VNHFRLIFFYPVTYPINYQNILMILVRPMGTNFVSKNLYGLTCSKDKSYFEAEFTRPTVNGWLVVSEVFLWSTGTLVILLALAKVSFFVFMVGDSSHLFTPSIEKNWCKRALRNKCLSFLFASYQVDFFGFMIRTLTTFSWSSILMKKNTVFLYVDFLIACVELSFCLWCQNYLRNFAMNKNYNKEIRFVKDNLNRVMFENLLATEEHPELKLYTIYKNIMLCSMTVLTFGLYSLPWLLIFGNISIIIGFMVIAFRTNFFH